MSSRLIDPFQRRIDYLRVSVTDRCDLRCTYGMPKGLKGFEEPEHWLRHDEMTRLVGLFVAQGLPLYLQTAARGIGVINGLDASFHPFAGNGNKVFCCRNCDR